jgi:hypothetical protein
MKDNDEDYIYPIYNDLQDQATWIIRKDKKVHLKDIITIDTSKYETKGMHLIYILDDKKQYYILWAYSLEITRDSDYLMMMKKWEKYKENKEL